MTERFSTHLHMAGAIKGFSGDLKFAVRWLARAKGLTLTVDRLLYIRQSARGMGAENAAFSAPEILDLRERVKTVSEFGDFSVIGFTVVGLGEPREVRAGVVGGSYFRVMGLRPVLGRLLDMRDDRRGRCRRGRADLSVLDLSAEERPVRGVGSQRPSPGAEGILQIRALRFQRPLRSSRGAPRRLLRAGFRRERSVVGDG